jgi:hypothetical protein
MNFGKYKYCWVIQNVGYFGTYQVQGCKNSTPLANSCPHHYSNEELPQTFLHVVNTKPCYINQHCYGLLHCAHCFGSLHLVILFSKDVNLSVAPAAVNTIIMKWCK